MMLMMMMVIIRMLLLLLLLLLIIIMMIIIALKEQIEIFTISSLRRELFPTHTLKWPGRNRVQIT